MKFLYTFNRVSRLTEEVEVEIHADSQEEAEAKLEARDYYRFLVTKRTQEDIQDGYPIVEDISNLQND